MWNIMSGSGERRLEGNDLYSNFDMLVRQAGRLFKKSVQRQMGLKLYKVDDVGLSNEELKQSKIVDGTIVLRGSYRYGRNDGELFGGFNIKNGVLMSMSETVCDKNKIEYPVTRSGGKMVLSKFDSDKIVDTQGKTLLGEFVSKFIRTAADPDKKSDGPAETKERPIRYNPTHEKPIKKKDGTIDDSLYDHGLGKVKGFDPVKPEAEKGYEMKSLLQQIDTIVLRKRELDKTLENAREEMSGKDAEQQKLLKDLVGLNGNLDAIWDLGDRWMQVITKYVDGEAPKANDTMIMKALRAIPEISAKIDELSKSVAKTLLETQGKSETYIQQEVHNSDEPPASIKNSQNLDGVKNSLTERLKNLVFGFKELVSLLNNSVKGMKEVYDSVVTGTSVPKVPGGDSAVTAANKFGEYSKPTKSGLVSFMRTSKLIKEKSITKEVFSAWDKSEITDDMAHKKIESQVGVLGDNVVNNLADAAIEHAKYRGLASLKEGEAGHGAEIWKYYVETSKEAPPAIGQKHWQEIADAIDKRVGMSNIAYDKRGKKRTASQGDPALDDRAGIGRTQQEVESNNCYCGKCGKQISDADYEKNGGFLCNQCKSGSKEYNNGKNRKSQIMTDEEHVLNPNGEEPIADAGSGGIREDPKCPICGEFLDDAGDGDWDCSNGCLPRLMKLDEIKEMDIKTPEEVGETIINNGSGDNEVWHDEMNEV